MLSGADSKSAPDTYQVPQVPHSAWFSILQQALFQRSTGIMEFKREGLITGTMVKMFTIAGPVIVSGTVASAVYGLVLVLLGAAG